VRSPQFIEVVEEREAQAPGFRPSFPKRLESTDSSGWVECAKSALIPSVFKLPFWYDMVPNDDACGDTSFECGKRIGGTRAD